MLNGPRYDAFFFSSHVIIYPVSRSKVKKRKTDSIYFFHIAKSQRKVAKARGLNGLSQW